MELISKMSKLLLFSSLLICLELVKASNKSKDGPDPEARLVPVTTPGRQSRGGRSYTYTDNPSKWSDVDLAFPGAREMQLCATGVFLLYSHPLFDADDEHHVRLFSGIDNCLSVHQVGKIGSIQLATSFQPVYKPSLSLFKEPILKGRLFPVVRKMNNFGSVFAANVESLLINGKKNWTAVSSTGVNYCLQPTYDKEMITFPICIFTTLNDTAIGRDTLWKSVKPGCDAKGKKVEVTSCFQFKERARKIEPPTKPKPHLVVVNGKEEVLEPAIKECNKNEEFLTLLDLRLNNDFGSSFQVRFPKDKSQWWRTVMLDLSFDLVSHSCPIVNPAVLAVLREMFIYFIEKHAWSKGKGWPKDKENKNDTDTASYIQKMMHDLDECNQMVINGAGSNVIAGLEDDMSYLRMPYTYDTLPQINKDFHRKVQLDIIIDSVWMIANQIIGVCHQAFDSSDFWTDFYPLFRDMYLTPVVEFWGNSGAVKNYYRYLFGGIDLELEYAGLALCASRYLTTAHLFTYNRPEELAKLMTAPKKQ